VIDALPRSVQPAARRAIAEIRDAEDKAHAEAALRAFVDEFATKWPKAAAKLTDNKEELLRFYDYPAEHWVHLKTTNPIESSFATVRLRSKVTKERAREQRAWRWPTSCCAPPRPAGER
jgi:transposase-like protein